jgi:hypothetical protein
MRVLSPRSELLPKNLAAAHGADALQVFGKHAALTNHHEVDRPDWRPWVVGGLGAKLTHDRVAFDS